MWTLKFKPISINDMCIDKENKQLLNNLCKSTTMPNIIITGNPGSGKTSLSNCIANTIDSSHNNHMVNMRNDRGVALINNNISNIVKQRDKKCIVIDEVDSLTTKAQSLLDDVIISTPKVCFIMTCDDISSICTSIQSKCQIMTLKLTSSDIYDYLIKNVNIDKDKLKYISNNCNGDLRYALNISQSCNYDCISLEYAMNKHLDTVVNNIIKIIDASLGKGHRVSMSNSELGRGDKVPSSDALHCTKSKENIDFGCVSINEHKTNIQMRSKKAFKLTHEILDKYSTTDILMSFIENITLNASSFNMKYITIIGNQVTDTPSRAQIITIVARMLIA